MTFSTASKVVLNKSNLTSIAEYSMSWFKIPKNVYIKIDILNRNFLERFMIMIISITMYKL